MLHRLLILFSLIAVSFCVNGCFDSNVDEQSIPWGRPADWEGGAPGFGR